MDDRCSIYEEIDGLDASRDLSDLIARLKPILHKLAYELVAGESSARDYQEEWHRQYTHHLQSESGAERAARGAPGRPAAPDGVSIHSAHGAHSAHSSAPAHSGSSHGAHGGSSHGAHGGTHSGGAAHGSARQSASSARRQASGRHSQQVTDLPASLAQIFAGTHPSFANED